MTTVTIERVTEGMTLYVPEAFRPGIVQSVEPRSIFAGRRMVEYFELKLTPVYDDGPDENYTHTWIVQPNATLEVL